ncbi:MAG: hypothetical protein KatS3mg115_1048 [Candidatus Poribacteria bacterium]|nr:MAG: hypothetical protein KatS3mg115_1048 [Candidatus Poribacteria bacterium]
MTAREIAWSEALIVTHYDLDGFVSALCLLEAFGLSRRRVRFLSYGMDRRRAIERAVRELRARAVVLCDLALDVEDLEGRWMQDSRLQRVLFDHHEATDPRVLERFDLSYVDSSGDCCSADLVYACLEKIASGEVLAKLHPWVQLAHDRDLWINRYRRTTQRIGWLLRERIYERLDVARESSSPVEFLRRLRGQWRRGEALFYDALECARNTAVTFTDTPVPITIAYVKRDTSDVAEFLQPGGHLIVLLNLFGSHVGISLRAEAAMGVDVSEIARRCFGGGGHRLAASGWVDRSLLAGGVPSHSGSDRSSSRRTAPPDLSSQNLSLGGLGVGASGAPGARLGLARSDVQRFDRHAERLGQGGRLLGRGQVMLRLDQAEDVFWNPAPLGQFVQAHSLCSSQLADASLDRLGHRRLLLREMAA